MDVNKLPFGWFVTGSNPNDYHLGVDESIAHSGNRCGFVRARNDDPAGFATLMQAFTAGKLSGCRLKMSGWCKAWSVNGRAALWIRVDGETRKNLVLDNMEDRPIKGSVDWARYELVIDVPQEGTVISFGVLLNGPGQIWIDDLNFEKVGQEVAVTATYSKPGDTTSSTLDWPDNPVNLNFEQ